MSLEKFYKQKRIDEEYLNQFEFIPYYLKVQSELGNKLMVNNRELINLAANNYLGLSNDKRVKDAAIHALEKYGQSMCATPIASGSIELMTEVANALARFISVEDALIYPSCYQANNGLFPAIARPEDVIIIDRFAHSSLVEGARAVGCKLRPFLHNDMDNLEKQLKHSEKQCFKFVVTESVFSTEGSIAPLKEIVALCRKYDAIPVVDDSHGLGVIGKKGNGILAHAGIEDYDGIYTASLGKALANQGGVVGGRKSLIDFLRYRSSHLIYSTAILPSVLAGIKSVLGIIDAEFDSLSLKMWKYRNMLRKALLSKGFELMNAEAPITSVKTGNSLQTISLASQFYEMGILSTPFIFPSVPENCGVIRLIAGANLKEETIQEALDIIEKMRLI